MTIKIKHLKPLRLALLLGAAASLGIPDSISATNPVPPLITKDKVGSRVGVFRSGSAFTANSGGRSGAAGDYAVNFSPQNTGPVYVQDASFFNGPAAKDEATVAFWTKKYDIASGSAFWANSPSSNNGQRGYQAHVPWSNNNIYFDTAGCCDPDTRISAGIDTFPNYTGDIDWWTNSWHHVAFSKKGPNKQIWIDGILFLSGEEAAPLPTDFTDLYIGSDGAGNGLYHGLIDDFAVFSTQLSEDDLKKLAAGTSPSALAASTGLVALWDFNDFPAEGFFGDVTPIPNTSLGSPNLIRIVHTDGSTPWTQANISLKLDDVAVTPQFAKEGTKATVTYQVPNPLPIQSSHKVTLTYPGANGQPQTLEWQYVVGPYTKDSVATRIGIFTGGSGYTEAAEGHTGNAGDYGVDFGPGGTGPVRVDDGSFLNTAAANDEMTFALWVKKYDIADSSAFWAVSPSSTEGQRGFQAHVPWSNNNIYFDTAGCCSADTQRLNAGIDTFADYTGDVSWWTNWHFFVFSKKGENKQIWIDGKLFLEGVNTGPLPTDFTRLVIGGDSGTGNRIHGIIDDFSVFSKELTEAQINSLYTGASPSTLAASAGLLAYWDFNDVPAQGLFLSFSPDNESTNAAPNLVRVVHFQGATPWDLSKVSLKIDGNAVNANTTRTGSRVTISYTPSPLFAIGSSHTASLTYPNPDGTLSTQQWQFAVGPYTKDTVKQYVGRLLGPTQFTADAAGYSGKPGDYAIDFGKTQNGQAVHLVDPAPLNQAAADDEMAIAAWQKLHSLASSALFFGVAPSVNGGQRGWGSFPWGDSNIYFDTAGCCDGTTQRISQNIADFPGYTGDAGWWTNWHHFVYQKKGSVKEVWIDGQLFMQGDSTGVLPTDFTESYIGLDVPDNARMQGIVDDFAIFGTLLDQANIEKLAAGTLPSELPASTELLAYWNFNDATPVTGGATISVERGQTGKIRITYTGTLESTDSIGGAWAPVANASSPHEADTTGSRRFYRARN